MKKILISFIMSALLVTTTNGFGEPRVCETQYSIINGAKYFSSILCTEDISLSGVVVDNIALKDVSTRTTNDFIVTNNYRIVQHVKDGGICKDLNTLEEIQAFENIIYSNNDISYTDTISSIEDLTTEVEQLKEDYNSIGLYNIVFEEVKLVYPISSLTFLREQTRNEYFDRQLEMKTSILSKQKEKLTSIYKLTESQKFIERFYEQIDEICLSYYNEKWGDSSEEERNTETETLDEDGNTEKEALILKYKEEFNVKLGEKLDKMPRQTLEQLSVKLFDYAENSPIFKRFSDQQKELVKLKIIALKAAIDERLG